MTAHKNDLIKSVSSHNQDVPKEDIKLAVDLIFKYLSEQLIKQNRIEIRGFGSFSLRDRMNHKMHIGKKKRQATTYKTVYFRGNKNTQIISKN